MVEPQIVVLVVAGSSPVGHPPPPPRGGNPKPQIPSSKEIPSTKSQKERDNISDLEI